MRIADLAWAAGIVDGEGTIAITIAKAGVNRRATDGYQMRLVVAMTCSVTIGRLHELFGGTFTVQSPRDPVRHRPSYHWFVGDERAEKVLSRIVPYMITKRVQAELALEFRKRFSIRQIGKTPAREVARRHEFFLRLRGLNKKGPR